MIYFTELDERIVHTLVCSLHEVPASSQLAQRLETGENSQSHTLWVLYELHTYNITQQLVSCTPNCFILLLVLVLR